MIYAKQLKDEGNLYFKQKDLDKAISKWAKVHLFTKPFLPMSEGTDQMLSMINRTKVEEADKQEMLWWGKGVTSPAEYSHPHPWGWTIKGAGGAPLHKVTVSHNITNVLRRKRCTTPRCIQAWTNTSSSWHVTADIDWTRYARTYSHPLTTTRDVHTHFKHILHSVRQG